MLGILEEAGGRGEVGEEGRAGPLQGAWGKDALASQKKNSSFIQKPSRLGRTVEGSPRPC